ncbi:ABC transporter permease [Arthrobacter globiformis]|uniref:ABC transporter permease n=1 Tax=Arthrobacter globiformis TaxID=1665 RepID=UPI00278429F1|nr:ABC transporter permease [Arthrobacter globiformis]MDQ0867490.1 ribose/xylose/arabinose/galactoside ABC-type transport system permease subunit [Arthrobacter globiformis]
MTAQTQAPVPAAARETRPGTAQALAWSRRNTVYVALAALMAFNLIATSGFANVWTIQNLLFTAAPIILIAVGQTLAIGTGGIDLSVGSVMALASAVIAQYLGYGEPAALLAAVAAAGLIGAINGSLITFLRINPLITGLGLLVAVRGLAQALTGGARSDLPFEGFFSWLGTASVAGIPVVALAAGGIAVAVAVAIRRTAFGRYALFAGSNRTAAFLAGTPRLSTLMTIYILSAVLAGIAGVMVSDRIGASDPSFIGVNFELTAIAAVVIGGTPLAGGKISIPGAVAAAVFLQLIDTTFVMHDLNFAFAQILKAILIVAALYLQRSAKESR